MADGQDDQSEGEATESGQETSEDQVTDESTDQASVDSEADAGDPEMDTSQASIGTLPDEALAFNEYDKSWIDSGSEVA
jgi:hypothetical protein